jgi:hypothetical protein
MIIINYFFRTSIIKKERTIKPLLTVRSFMEMMVFESSQNSQ